MDVPDLVRRAMLLGVGALAALGLAGCGPPAASDVTATAESQLSVQNASPTPGGAGAATALPAPTQPISPTAAPPATGPQAIFIDTPAPGTLVGSPMQITGRTQRMPASGQLGYQVIGASGQVIGSSNVPVAAASDGSGAFNAPITFTLPQNGGNVTVRLFENNPDGTQAAIESRDVYVQSQVQSITIDTPPAGTQVGSPMVLTGQLARMPSQGRLLYWVRNSSQQEIGSGSFDVFGEPGRPASYAGSLYFNLPFDGDTITAQIYEDPASGSNVTSSPISLYVAPVPQQILIDTPPPGTLVGSPMTLTGRTVRFPESGSLTYRVTNSSGGLIGGATFPVGGTAGSGAQFNTQVAFSVPRDGGLIRVTLADPNTPNGPVESSIDLDVLAQYPGITIDTPRPGTQVGSPMTITGRTNQFPSSGQLLYRVLDAGNATIGSGVVPMAGTPGGRGSFNAQLVFNEPPNGGVIRVELTDQASGGGVVATAVLQLNVAPPPPPQVLIDTPPPGTQVGSPMTLTGRTTYVPNGALSYRITDAAGAQIGQGSVVFKPSGRQTFFNAQLTFSEPPAGGNIVVQISGPSPVASAPPISSSITLYVAPRP
ncbi:MAG TPA: Gmad2 immunoglobulin-like domain-containing protein [Roseiflexaceae bacterium]|nr:Gmad2 immunoglobulin-like domain-containing protein [Roseiflexaceae bacterium]